MRAGNQNRHHQLMHPVMPPKQLCRLRTLLSTKGRTNASGLTRLAARTASGAAGCDCLLLSLRLSALRSRALSPATAEAPCQQALSACPHRCDIESSFACTRRRAAKTWPLDTITTQQLPEVNSVLALPDVSDHLQICTGHSCFAWHPCGVYMHVKLLPGSWCAGSSLYAWLGAASNKSPMAQKTNRIYMHWV